MAFVTGGSWVKAAVTESGVCSRSGARWVMAVEANDDGVSAVSRRAVLLGGIAAVAAAVGAGSPALAGDGPKYSIFGGGAMSSPFTYTITKKGPILYKKFNPEEIELFTNTIKEGKRRIALTAGYIDERSWEDVRSEIRRQTQDMRKYQFRLMEALDDDTEAQDAYKQFKNSLEKLDYLARVKDADRAKREQATLLRALDNWASKTGITL
uniref:Extrinsic protein in photosystem II n=1 Tax=Compsopogon caeruleus TaxID=31354 RepID=A0A7S1TF77_9RHOD|mmetsp:Transcript_4573/g.9143  ORF Transcript_4573/g.9143 Transcript_4573/m.9143 type:complete len:210 (+) Transcript_4573:135-764(+)